VIYFRVAMRTDQSSLWKWRSTVLNSPDTLFGFLKIYKGTAKNRMRVFFASSIEFLNEMLVRENSGLVSNSVTVEQFLENGKRIPVLNIKRLESELGLQANKELVAKSAITRQLGDERPPFHATPPMKSANHAISGSPLHSREVSLLELMQEESERRRGGDYDTPYTFALPSSMREALAWTRLLAKVQRGELEP
jgi:hypothetical protein